MMKIQVTILIFSGRPNPSWELEGDEAKEIIRQWKNLKNVEQGRHMSEPKLGYQGCKVDINPSEYLIFLNGYVYYFNEGKQVFQREDPGRRNEKYIISTAPDTYKDLIEQVNIF